MNKLLCMLLTAMLSVAVSVPAFTQDVPKKKVAVYMTGSTEDDAYKKVIGAKLVSAITESGEYAAVERTADFLAALAAESDYQTSGEVRDSQIARLGQKFGVRYVVVADVSELFDEYFIAARMINVETGLVEKAFDTNGPAESMSQLVALSKSVATGLLTGLASSSGSSTPIHLSLCAMDRNGKTQYLTAEQWQNMPESKKLDYTKKGVVIAENGEAFIVAMRDAGEGTWNWAVSNYNLPSTRQLHMIYKYKNPLNNALCIFGGEMIQPKSYWSNELCDSSGAWSVSMPYGNVGCSIKASTGRVRAVAPVVAAM